MNSLETELIQIPKSHLKSMNARFRGIKNLIRINVAKENELRILQNKYQKMEAEHSDMVHDSRTGFSNGTQPASYHNILPLQNSCSKIKADTISQETYFDILTQLCHATSVIRELKEKETLKIESWTQTDDINSPMQPSDAITELTHNCEALQSKMEEQQLELQSSMKKIEDLTKQLEQEKSARKLAMENEKKHRARLQREQEMHEETKKKLQEFKVKLMPQNVVSVPIQNCLLQAAPFLQQQQQQQYLTVDCAEKDIPSLQKCSLCHRSFSTNDELEYHNNLCKKSRENSNK